VRFSNALAAVRVLAVALVVAVLAPAAAQAASATLPPVTISPLRGTPDATPTTQISFLGVPASDLSQITVRGSRSGSHSGTLEAYSTGTGASYLPSRPFRAGEHVTVTAVESVASQKAIIRTSFTIATLYTLPLSSPPKTAPVAPPGTTQAFVSAPQLHPPKLTVTVPAADPALGDIFLAPKDGAPQQGPMIVSPTGQLVWFDPLPLGTEATNLEVQSYLGQPVLTYWQGHPVENVGVGYGVIDNTNYQTIATVKAGNGLSMDLHEFDVEPNGTAYVVAFEPVYENLISLGGPARAIVDDCVVQEVDVRTGLVMFEWHAMGHISLSDSYVSRPSRKGSMWNAFHVNSIYVESNQDLLISARATWTVYEVDPSDGEIVWRLGGRHSSFRLGPGVHFAWQHDATRLPDGTIQIFDNEDEPEVESRSRGIDIALNFANHTAKLLHQYTIPGQTVLANSQGDVQQLANGDTFVGWGEIGIISEFTPAGALSLEMKLPGVMNSYRVYRFPWNATPATPPAIVASSASGSGTTQFAVSWNGATGVLSWQVLAGASASTLAPVGAPVPSSGFETMLTAATGGPYVAVQALGAGGVVLGTSATITPS
jgi:hypothetical protein